MLVKVMVVCLGVGCFSLGMAAGIYIEDKACKRVSAPMARMLYVRG